MQGTNRTDAAASVAAGASPCGVSRAQRAIVDPGHS
jgi:hypothetical protein